MVYQPREDTWLMINVVKQFIRKKEIKKALDMGTGTGVIAKELAKNCGKVVAVDVDPEAIEFAKKDAPSNISFIQSDLFENVKELFDLIVFNPPYLPPEPQPEEFEGAKISEWAGGRPLILKFLRQASAKLNTGGSIILLFSSRTGLELGELQNMGFKLSKLGQTKFFYEDLWVYELVPA